jgi:hypothetical protein
MINFPVSFFSASSTPWTPAQIATSAWYDASDSATIVQSGGAVSQWNDKSGNGSRNLVQATGTNQPTTGTRSQNGLNMIDFNGTNSNMTGGTWFSARSSFSVYAVYLDDAPTDSIEHVMVANTNGDGTGRNFLLKRNTNIFGTFLGNVNRPFYNQPETTALFSSTWSWSSPSTTINPYLNGTLGTSQTTSTEANTSSGFRVGCSRTATSFYNGAIAEIIFVSGVDSTTTRQLIEGYLAHKWGLSANLPSDHPYKSSAPTV